MEQVFIVAIIITILFTGTKFIEMRFLNGDNSKPIPLKDVVRDALVVLVCSITGSYIYFNFQNHITDFFNVVTETKVLNAATTQVFTDAPAF